MNLEAALDLTACTNCAGAMIQKQLGDLFDAQEQIIIGDAPRGRWEQPPMSRDGLSRRCDRCAPRDKPQHEIGPYVPQGVDPALWAEFQEINEHVHKLYQRREYADDEEEEAGPKPPVRRMMIDVLEEEFVLFAWMFRRELLRRKDNNGPTHLTPARIDGAGNRIHNLVRSYMERVLNNHFHDELHRLCMGSSWLLRPEPPRPPRSPVTDLDDDKPF